MVYRSDTHPGVAWRIVGDCPEHWQCTVAVMVGDDHEWHLDATDLHVIEDEEYCSGCGQIGCGWSNL